MRSVAETQRFGVLAALRAIPDGIKHSFVDRGCLGVADPNDTDRRTSLEFTLALVVGHLSRRWIPACIGALRLDRNQVAAADQRTT